MNAGFKIPGRFQERLAISFWLWNYFYGVKKGDVFHDLERRFAELRERGFNAIRVDSGAGLVYDASGRSRGEIALHEPFGRFSALRQMDQRASSKRGGCRCDVLKRVVELFELAEKYDVGVILSSWFYLHTFWFAEKDVTDELFALPPERRFMRFAEDCDRIVSILKEKGLAKRIAFVEIFNEADGLPFIAGYGEKESSEKRLLKYRQLHEDALAFLRGRHPDVLFAYDSYTPYTRKELFPRNAQVWNLHSYYMWPVYGVLEGKLLKDGVDLQDPESYASIRGFLRSKLVSLDEIRRAREGRPPASENWNRRVWLYMNVEPKALPALERLLTETLVRDAGLYRRSASDAVDQAMKLRDELAPGAPLVMGEAATYCALPGMRWEEKSDVYWEIVERMARRLKEEGFWGCMPRTNSGPEDPSWTEFPERLKRVNELFLSK